LSAADREAVLLRYYRQASHRQIAEQFRISEDTAEKRVNRALDKLRKIFAKQGVTLSAVALTGALTASASATPTGLAGVVSQAVLTGGGGTLAATETALLAKGALHAMFIAKVKTVSLTAAACLVVAGSGVVAAKQLSGSPMPVVVAAPVSAGTPTSAEPGATVAQVKPSQTQAQPVSSPAGTIDEAELERRRRLEDAARMGATGVKPSSGTPLDEEKERRIQQELRQYPSSPKMPPPATEKGAIAGVIVDETGNPLNRVQMSLYGVGCNEYDVTHTGPDGAFLFEAVPANKPFALEACQRTGVADFVTPREPVTAVIGQTNHIGRLTLTARPAAAVGSVRGVVVGSPYAEFEQLRAAEMKGDPIPWKPVAGAQVTVSIPQCKDHVGAETRVETKSGPDGSFTLDNIPVHSGVALRVNSPDRKQEGGIGYLRVLSGQVTDAGTVQIRPPYPWPAGIK
jgi:hypothetical protein